MAVLVDPFCEKKGLDGFHPPRTVALTALCTWFFFVYSTKMAQPRPSYSFAKGSGTAAQKSAAPSGLPRLVHYSEPFFQFSWTSHEGMWVRDQRHGGSNWVWWFDSTFPRDHPVYLLHHGKTHLSALDKQRLRSKMRQVRAGKIFRARLHRLGIVPEHWATERDSLAAKAAATGGSPPSPWYPHANGRDYEREAWLQYFYKHPGVHQKPGASQEVQRAHARYASFMLPSGVPRNLKVFR